MKHEHLTNDLRERAALYSLGALPAEDAAVLAMHLARGCTVCAREVGTQERLVGALGQHATAVAPRPALREQVLAAVPAAPSTVPPSTVRPTTLAWEPGAIPGVVAKPLFADAATGRFTNMVRMEAGVSYPGHRHTDTEELFLLSGDLSVEGEHLFTGDYCAAPAGTIHAHTFSERGCTFVVTASDRDVQTDEPSLGASQPGLIFLRAHEGSWRLAAPGGISVRTLAHRPNDGHTTALVRMPAGSRLPRRRLARVEEAFVVDGSCHGSDEELRAGDYYRATPGSLSDGLATEEGCLVLLLNSGLDGL